MNIIEAIDYLEKVGYDIPAIGTKVVSTIPVWGCTLEHFIQDKEYFEKVFPGTEGVVEDILIGLGFTPILVVRFYEEPGSIIARLGPTTWKLKEQDV